MTKAISAADANRQFSQLLRGVREERAEYVITSHGKPVARIVPIERPDASVDRARATLMRRLRSQGATGTRNWERHELYDRKR